MLFYLLYVLIFLVQDVNCTLLQPVSIILFSWIIDSEEIKLQLKLKLNIVKFKPQSRFIWKMRTNQNSNYFLEEKLKLNFGS